MQILILGGTGVISRYVVKKYRDEGHHVVVLNRGNRKKLHISNVEYRYADTNGRDALSAAVGADTYDKILDFTTFDSNIMKMKVETLENKCRHYVFISSVAAYERMDSCTSYTEDMPLGNSRWEYGYKKSCCEKVLRQMYDGAKSGSYTIIRPGITYSDSFIPYSPMDTYNMPGYLIQCILSGEEILTSNQGEDRIQVLYAQDFADNLYRLLNLEKCFGDCFNISGDEYVTSNQIMEKLVELLGIPANICYLPQEKIKGELSTLIRGGWHDTYSNQKVKNLLVDYRAEEKISEHLQEAIDFYRQNQEWMVWPKYMEEQIRREIAAARIDGIQ